MRRWIYLQVIPIKFACAEYVGKKQDLKWWKAFLSSPKHAQPLNNRIFPIKVLKAGEELELLMFLE